MRSRFALGPAEHDVHLARSPGGYRLHVDDEGPVDVALRPGSGGRLVLSVDGAEEPVAVALQGDDVHVHLGGRTFVLSYRDPVRRHGRDGAGSADDVAAAPMPGSVLAVLVAPGDAVEAGDGLVVIESMKLETTIRAPRAGRVEAVHVEPGRSFDRGQPLVTLAEAA